MDGLKLARFVRDSEPDKAVATSGQVIENFFCKLKEFKRIAMRCDKTDQTFAAMIYLAAAIINSR
jgi:transposase